jgi:hypothetical protein
VAKVVLAVAHQDAHALAAAVGNEQQSDIDKMVAAGKAFEVDAGTPVTVVGESYNERQVEVMDGPHKGQTGWVPFEWLKRSLQALNLRIQSGLSSLPIPGVCGASISPSFMRSGSMWELSPLMLPLSM